MLDIVIPHNNEKEFLTIAEKLGYNSLIFLYPSEKDFCKFTSTTTKILNGLLTTKGGRGKHITVMQSSDNDQHTLEHNPPNVLFGCETPAQKDYLHQRASGLNHILCTLAHKNNVTIAFAFSPLISASGFRRAQILGRIMQNIKLCRKYDVMTAIASFATDPHQMRAPKDLKAIFVLLGMHPAEAQKALQQF